MSLPQICKSMITFLAALPGWLVIACVRLYQYTLSPLLGQQCRFRPTCSQYMILAIQKYGVLRGVPRGVWRICKCHPWHPGGQDLP